MARCKTKWNNLCLVSDLELKMDKSHPYLYSKLNDYHYQQMLNRLNEMPGKLRSADKELEEAGYLIKELWRKYEGGLVVHDKEYYGWNHEDYLEKQGNKRKDKEKNYEKGMLFGEKEGKFGVFVDLLYDTCLKKWSKAYQETFHEFFHNIDHLAYLDSLEVKGSARIVTKEYLSHSLYEKNKLFDDNAEHNFGEFIEKEAEYISSSERNDIHKLNERWKKGCLYDIMGGAYGFGKYGPGTEFEEDDPKEKTGHDMDYWEANGRFYENLATETFAHMASIAVVNPQALVVMKRYLPESYKMFVEILEAMTRTRFVIEAG